MLKISQAIKIMIDAIIIGVSGVSFAAMNPERRVGIVIASDATLELIPRISP